MVEFWVVLVLANLLNVQIYAATVCHQPIKVDLSKYFNYTDERSTTRQYSVDDLQYAVNGFVDVGLAAAKSVIPEIREGFVDLPDYVNPQESGMLDYEMVLSEGTFGDLSTLRRLDDAVLARKRDQLSVALGLELDAELCYKYMIKYVFPVEGNVSVVIEGITIHGAASIDFNFKPCRINVDELKIVRVENLVLDVTGMSFFGSYLSKFINAITNIFRNVIIHQINTQLIAIASENVARLNCERFRPND